MKRPLKVTPVLAAALVAACGFWAGKAESAPHGVKPHTSARLRRSGAVDVFQPRTRRGTQMTASQHAKGYGHAVRAGTLRASGWLRERDRAEEAVRASHRARVRAANRASRRRILYFPAP